MNRELLEKWGDGIPAYADADPRNPEWRETPAILLDLTGDGYGEIIVKDEGDPASNPTRTIKDRAAWELATLYRDYARALYLKMRAGKLNRDDLRRTRIPVLSMITAGNEGVAVENVFTRYNLPPPKLILDKNTPADRLEKLKRLRADIYLVDLSRKGLSSEEIKLMSDNTHGVDITSQRIIEPQAVFYDWKVHEDFNCQPDEIYVPYGSGRLMENYLYWQKRTMHNAVVTGRPDPRLRANSSDVINMNILGAEPENLDSIADKLPAHFKPFLIFRNEDLDAAVNFSFTGRKTGKYKVAEQKIAEAYHLLQKYGIEAEPSAAAGLALYLQRYEKGLVDARTRVLVVSTGIGV